MFDPKTNAVAYNAQSYLLNGVASRKTFDQSLGGNNYRIKARFAKTPAPCRFDLYFKGPNSFQSVGTGHTFNKLFEFTFG